MLQPAAREALPDGTKSGIIWAMKGRPENLKAAAIGTATMLLVALTATALAQGTPGEATAVAHIFSLGEVFTFLFITLGPLKVIGPFAAMTRGKAPEFKQKLATSGTAISVIAALAAATIGASILEKWGISAGALMLTAGLILFLVALKPVLEQYEPKAPKSEPDPSISPSALAFSPLAFPTIVTPYGIAVLILMVTLAGGVMSATLPILGIAAFVLLLDYLAMVFADKILAVPFLAPILGVVGSVMSVLQVALGVQASLGGLRLLGIIS